MQLHKRDVIDVATSLLDDYGIADLTMRRLARELNVTPGALYWHFANKQELLGAVADRILDRFPVTGTEDWQDTVVAVGSALRDALLSHTDGAELVSASFAAGQSRAAADIIGLLSAAALAAGVAPQDSEPAARTVVYYVLGFTVDEQSRRQWDSAGALPSGDTVLTTDHDRRFAFGLRLLVDGLRAHSRLS